MSYRWLWDTEGVTIQQRWWKKFTTLDKIKIRGNFFVFQRFFIVLNTLKSVQRFLIKKSIIRPLWRRSMQTIQSASKPQFRNRAKCVALCGLHRSASKWTTDRFFDQKTLNRFQSAQINEKYWKTKKFPEFLPSPKRRFLWPTLLYRDSFSNSVTVILLHVLQNFVLSKNYISIPLNNTWTQRGDHFPREHLCIPNFGIFLGSPGTPGGVSRANSFKYNFSPCANTHY